MPRKDIYHEIVKEALIKDGWTITHDPLTLLSKVEGGLQTDLGAEKVIVAEKGLKKIGVEVKSFTTPSAIHEFIKAAGQYRAYIVALRIKKQERIMYLAIPTFAWKTLENKEVIQGLISDSNIHLILFDPLEKVIKSWRD
jgi:hypothetical protein